MSIKADLAFAYQMGYDDALGQRRPEPRKAEDMADGIARENAKLRELCRRFAEYTDQDRCLGCVVKRACRNGDVEECWQFTEIRELAHELGIEVAER